MDERNYPEGVDCVWIASDRDGRVGAFATGGAGPIPVPALRPDRPSLDDIEALIDDLPSTSSARLLVPLSRPDDFLGFARRGFFAYDWTDTHRTTTNAIEAYELIAVPGEPLSAKDLPGQLAMFLEEMGLDMSFAHEPAIGAATLLPYTHPKKP